jgi:hypothetical protein
MVEDMSEGMERNLRWLKSYLSEEIQRIPTGVSLLKHLRTTIFHLVCEQNIRDIRLRL